MYGRFRCSNQMTDTQGFERLKDAGRIENLFCMRYSLRIKLVKAHFLLILTNYSSYYQTRLSISTNCILQSLCCQTICQDFDCFKSTDYFLINCDHLMSSYEPETFLSRK